MRYLIPFIWQENRIDGIAENSAKLSTNPDQVKTEQKYNYIYYILYI